MAGPSPLSPSAFPQNEFSAYTTDREGLSIRDWFAGQALVGLLASSTYSNAGDGFEDFIAAKAGNIADAMLIEREKAEANNA